MLKRSSIKKICLAVFCLLLMLILYLFPQNRNHNDTLEVETKVTVTSVSDIVYLVDLDDYVARINVSLSADSAKEKALQALDFMTYGSQLSSLIPNGFKPIIPANTKVISSELVDGNLKLNFTKELLNVPEEDEMRLIESILYTVTSINSIKSVTILVEGKILSSLPHSKEQIPNPLDRSFGINKKYDLDKIKGTTKTTLYYLSKYNNYYYYVPVTKISNDNSEKIEIIIKELTSRPIYETNLMSYLNSEATIQNYEILGKELNIDFNNAILSDITKNNILEEVTYAINLSIKDNYDLESVSYNVNNEKIMTFDLKSLE